MSKSKLIKTTAISFTNVCTLRIVWLHAHEKEMQNVNRQFYEVFCLRFAIVV